MLGPVPVANKGARWSVVAGARMSQPGGTQDKPLRGGVSRAALFLRRQGSRLSQARMSLTSSADLNADGSKKGGILKHTHRKDLLSFKKAKQRKKAGAAAFRTTPLLAFT